MNENEKYLLAFFGRQSDYYIEKYHAFKSGDKYAFNIGSFLAGLFWFFYRKMYLNAFLIITLTIIYDIVEGVIFELLNVSAGFRMLTAAIVYTTLYGFFGNWLYFNYSEKQVARVLARVQDDDERLRILQRKGGVTWIPIFVIFGLFALAIIIYNNSGQY
jgi:hypothetical protein